MAWPMNRNCFLVLPVNRKFGMTLTTLCRFVSGGRVVVIGVGPWMCTKSIRFDVGLGLWSVIMLIVTFGLLGCLSWLA